MKSLPALLAILAFAILGIFLIYPIIYVLKEAFILDGRPSAHFLLNVLQDPSFLDLVLNSFNLAISATLISAILSVPLSMLMVQRSFRGKSFVEVLLIAPLILPPFVGAIGLKRMLARFGPVNLLLMDFNIIDSPIDFLGGGSFWAIALTQALHLFPLLYLNISASLAALDPALLDAGKSVGARPFPIFFRIMLPLLTAAFFSGGSLVFIASFTDLGTPLIFNFDRLLPVAVFSMRDQVHENPDGYALVAVMMFLVAVVFIASRYIASGERASSATKGISRRTPHPLIGASRYFAYLFLFTVLGLALLPHFGVFLLSISSRWFMSITPQELAADSYMLLLSHPLTAGSIKNSLLLSLSSSFLDIILGISIAYILSRTMIPFRKTLDTLVMLSLAIPGIVVAFGYLVAFAGTPIDPRLNPFYLLIAGYAVRRLPYMVRSAFAGFQESSITLEEAAKSVGAGPSNVLFRITLPLLFPHIAAGAILCFAFAMLEVSESLILAMEERYFPLTKAMYALLARPDGLGIASALGIVGMFIIGISLILSARLSGKSLAGVFKV